jgi:outer membrane protein OmpA-like peptidoglycan-associated protein
VSIAAVQGCPTAAEAAKTSLPSITFEFGSAQLRPEAMVQLQNLGKSLKEDLSETSTFVIEGHTDATGAYDYNRELSMQRAQAVKDYLAQQMGVKQPLEITGVGYCDLANPGDPRAAENRRVVVINKAS